jgi:hypothetical protein
MSFKHFSDFMVNKVGLAGNPLEIVHTSGPRILIISDVGIIIPQNIKLSYFGDEKYTLIITQNCGQMHFLMKVRAPFSLLLHLNSVYVNF